MNAMKTLPMLLNLFLGGKRIGNLSRLGVKTDPPPPFTSEPHFIANEAGEQNL